MAAMKSFHTEKCCHLVSENEASAGAYAAAFRQFLIYSSFILDTEFINTLTAG